MNNGTKQQEEPDASANVGGALLSVGDPIPSFVFNPVAVSWFLRLAEPLTRFGRIRHQTRAAHRFSTDLARLQRLGEMVTGALNLGSISEATERAIIRDALSFLVLQHAKNDATKQACEWLAQLDRLFADDVCRVPLRWLVIGSLLHAGSAEVLALQAETERFLADPLLPDAPGGVAAALALTNAIQARLPSSVVVGVLEKAGPVLRRHPSMRAAEALCRCPPRFVSAREAAEWRQRTPPEALLFSKKMRARAYVIAARALEWEHDGRAMVDAANQARETDPDLTDAYYWALRGALQLLPDAPAEWPELPATLPDTPEWWRLQRMVALRQTADLALACELVTTVSSVEYGNDLLERDLLIAVVRHTLAHEIPSSEESVRQSALIAAAVQEIAGRLPWAEVYIAHKEIRIERAYAPALERLESSDVAGHLYASDLSRAGRILAGMSPRSHAGSGLLAALDWAMAMVFGLCSDEGKADAVLACLAGAAGDPWARLLPSLIDCARALEAWMLAAAGGPNTCSGARRDKPYDVRTPAWARWLHSRAQLEAVDSGSSPQSLDELPFDLSGVAWMAEGWMAYRAVPARVPDALRQRVTAAVDATVRALDAGSRRATEVLVRSRRGLIPGNTGGAGALDVGAAVELGPLVAAVAAIDVRTEQAIVVAREDLSRGATGEAVERLRAAAERTKQECPLARRWWEPVVNYWLGVALARAGSPEAPSVLKALCGGPREAASRGQLALLALRGESLDEAAQWLCGTADDIAAVRYARALLAHRRGLHGEACALLEDPASEAVFSGTPYLAAAIRLLAAIAERTGNVTRAAELHAKLLARQGDDAIATARQARRTVAEAYGGASNGSVDVPALMELETRLRRAISHPVRAVPWAARYVLLCRTLAEDTGRWQALRADIGAANPDTSAALPPWMQVLARRSLAIGDARRALDFMAAGESSEAPAAYRRSRLALQTWADLIEGWACSHAPTTDAKSEAEIRWLRTIRRALDGFAALGLVADQDPVVKRLRVFCRWVGALEGGGCEQAASWQELAPWPASGVPELWNADAGLRAQAAEQVAAALESGACAWSASQRQLLTFLAARIRGQDDIVLANYAVLVRALDHLPVAGPDVWMAAAEVWYRSGAWKELIEGDLPDCVAALDHPAARFLVGLAYARSAVEDLGRNDTRKALQKVRQAQSTLEGLVDGGGKPAAVR